MVEEKCTATTSYDVYCLSLLSPLPSSVVEEEENNNNNNNKNTKKNKYIHITHQLCCCNNDCIDDQNFALPCEGLVHELLEWIVAGRHCRIESGMSRQSRDNLTSNDGKSKPGRSLSPSSKLQDRFGGLVVMTQKEWKDAIAKGALLSWRNRSGSSYLHRAAQCGNISIAEALVSKIEEELKLLDIDLCYFKVTKTHRL